MKAGLRQLGCDDAPEQPDRKPEMLGKNRPDEITLSDGFARGFPERLVLRIPIRNPGRIPLPHQYVPFWVAIAAGAKAIPLRADGKTKNADARRSKASFQGGGVAGCVLCQNCDAASVGGASRCALQASCQPPSGRAKSQEINRMSRPSGSLARIGEGRSALRRALLQKNRAAQDPLISTGPRP